VNWATDNIDEHWLARPYAWRGIIIVIGASHAEAMVDDNRIERPCNTVILPEGCRLD
jgi:hypothetical protein